MKSNEETSSSLKGNNSECSVHATSKVHAVVHMDKAEKFKELFVLAYCIGQAFAKP